MTERSQFAPARADRSSFNAAPSGLLQRKCACGGSPGIDGDCAGCRDTRLQRSESHRGDPGAIPPIVHEVLRSPGQPLDAATRAFMEARFADDFGNVRIHTDARAAESARAVGALAYTAGRSIVLGAGQYAPDTFSGRSLLAHELTHVLQQSQTWEAQPSAQRKLEIGPSHDYREQEADRVAREVTAISDPTSSHTPGKVNVSPIDASRGTLSVQRRSLDGNMPMGSLSDDDPASGARAPVTSHGGTLPFREATELAHCIEIMGDDNAAYCRQQVLGEAPPPAPPLLCDPDRALTWSDFQGAPQGGSASAETNFRHDLVTDGGQQIIRATFEGAKSWVRAKFADPTNRAVNGCAPEVARCERFFDQLPANQTGTFNLRAPTGCAASIAPDTSLTATTHDDCDTLLGAECDRVAPLESDRLLQHEQLHFDIACVLAKKGTTALSTRPASDAPKILAAVRLKASQISNSSGQYDKQTAHGCNAGPQSTWEADVQNDLPSVTIP